MKEQRSDVPVSFQTQRCKNASDKLNGHTYIWFHNTQEMMMNKSLSVFLFQSVVLPA